MSAIVLIVVMSAFAGGWNYNTAEDAAMNCQTIQQCLNEGYQVESCVPQQYMYLIAPTGTYAWGEMNIELRADPTLGLPPMSFTCFVNARERHGRLAFRETHQTVLIPIR